MIKKLLLLVAAMIVAAVAAHGQGGEVWGVTFDNRLNYSKIMSGAQVQVFPCATDPCPATPNTPASTLYTNLGLSLPVQFTNYVLSNGNGNYWFFVQPGEYLLGISGTSFQTQYIPIQVSLGSYYINGGGGGGGGGGSGNVTACLPSSWFAPNAVVTSMTGSGYCIMTPNSASTLDGSGNFATPGSYTSGLYSAQAGMLVLTSGLQQSVTVGAFTETVPLSMVGWMLVHATASASGLPHYSCVSNICTETIGPVTGGDIATQQVRRPCSMVVGTNDAASALVNTNLGPQGDLCYVPAPSTIVEVDVSADAGTPNVIVGRDRAGSNTNILSGALATASSGGHACSNAGGTLGLDGLTTCSATLQNTDLNTGDYLQLVSGTAGGTAKRMSITVIYTVN